MIDIASISAALTSARAILELARNAHDAQLAMKISAEVAKLQEQLINVQQQALALQTENHNLQDELRQLRDTREERKTIQKDLIPEENAYFRFVGGKKTGPFCTACWDDSGKLIRLTCMGMHMHGGNWKYRYICALHPKHETPMSKDYTKELG